MSSSKLSKTPDCLSRPRWVARPPARSERNELAVRKVLETCGRNGHRSQIKRQRDVEDYDSVELKSEGENVKTHKNL